MILKDSKPLFTIKIIKSDALICRLILVERWRLIVRV
jgi:hypothetical protein